MEDDALVSANLANLGDRLDHADFVVNEHDRNQNRVRAQRGLEHFEIKQTVFLNIEIRDFESLALQFAAGVQNGFVLGLDGDEMLALARVEVRRAFQREIVRFGRAGGPHDFLGIGIHKTRHFLPRLFHCCFGFPAECVRA